jgi:hypothetical protein
VRKREEWFGCVCNCCEIYSLQTELRHPGYRRTGTQGLFNDPSFLFDRSPPPLDVSNSLNRPLLGSVHLSLVDTYRCAHKGSILTYSHLVQTVHTSRLRLKREVMNPDDESAVGYEKTIDESRFPPFLRLFGILIHPRRSQQLHIQQKIGNKKQTSVDSN